VASAGDVVIIGRSSQVISEVIQEMGEVTTDIGLRINIDKTKYMNTSKLDNKNMHPKTKIFIMKNIKKHWVQWLLIIIIVEKMSEQE
jgi:hypothetical protein